MSSENYNSNSSTAAAKDASPLQRALEYQEQRIESLAKIVHALRDALKPLMLQKDIGESSETAIDKPQVSPIVARLDEPSARIVDAETTLQYILRHIEI